MKSSRKDRLIAAVALEIVRRKLEAATHEAHACEQELEAATIRARKAKQTLHTLSALCEEASVRVAALRDYANPLEHTKVQPWDDACDEIVARLIAP